MTSPFSRTLLAIAFGATILATTAAHADTYPSKPVTIVVPYAPGGNIDTTARLMAHAMSALLKQPVLVDNRAGAGGTVGAAYAARSKADGYTLLLGSSATIGTAPAVYKHTGYDPMQDFSLITGLNTVPMVLTVGARQPKVANFAQLVAASKKIDGGVTVATSGNGSSNHLALELLKRQTGLVSTHVPYKGAAPALTDLLGGQVDAQIDQLNSSLPYLRDGRIRAIAQLGSKRSSLLPNVPTLAEQGVKGFDAVTYTALFTPAGTPSGVQTQLIAAAQAALKDPAVIKSFEDMGAERVRLGQDAFAAFVKADTAKWHRTAHDASISVD